MPVRNLRTRESPRPTSVRCIPLGATSTIRTPLLASRLGLVESVRGAGPGQTRTPVDFSADFQVCLPYRGLFVWHVGNDDVVGDANQVLFVSGGERYCLSQPVAGEYAELIITPDLELLSELAGVSAQSLRVHSLFRRRSRRADFGLQRLCAQLLHASISGNGGGMVREELMISLLRQALDADANERAAGRSTRRLIGRTKEFLEAYLSSPMRLADVAQAVGASPAYLTDAFRRFEGISLHRYLTQLRLARALVEVPHARNLTTLAIGLGFSSHSHFTAAFRRAFGCTPSQYRQSTRTSVAQLGRHARLD